MRPLRSFVCAHEYLRAFEPHRVYLRCEKCGHQTPGLRDDYADLGRPRPCQPPPLPARTFTVVTTRARKRASA